MTIGDVIHERGPLTVAAFMDLALYHPEFGYYARVAQRSGRAGDFFTSVDVGPLFGELLEIQLAEMASILTSQFSIVNFDLVEAGAGNGRLSADIVRAMRGRDPELYDRTRLHLVEASDTARQAQSATLHDVLDRLSSSSESLPEPFEGVLFANELLDAFPVHQVVMREGGLREVYVGCGATLSRLRSPDSQASFGEARRSGEAAEAAGSRDGAAESRALQTFEGPLSTPLLAEYLARLGVTLEPGWRVEINLRAVEWVREAARRLRRGFIILIDYGHEARELYSVTHSGGTLTTVARHTMEGPESAGAEPVWLRRPGEQDITSHVDFTSIRAAAEAEGLTTLGFLDQTYFVLGLLPNRENPGNLENVETLQRRLALKTLLMPGGLGSTLKVLVLGKGVGMPALRGGSYRIRVT